MLRRKNRLSARVRLKATQLIRTPLFTLRVSQSGLDYNRYGFVVSKKVNKRAVKRNVIKRQFRAGVEQIETSIKKGNDFLFVIHPVGEKKVDAQKEVQQILKEKGFV